MDQDQQDSMRVGEASAKLLALEDFKTFMGEVNRRRDLIVNQAMLGRLVDHGSYLEARGAFLAFNEVVGLATQLKTEADEIREQFDGDAG